MTIELSNSAVVDIIEANLPVNISVIPNAHVLSALSDSITSQLLTPIKMREEASDRMMRELSRLQKERIERDRIRQLEQARREAEERRPQRKRGLPKRRDRGREDDGGVAPSRPLAVGAHGLARQDGKDGRDANNSNAIQNGNADLVRNAKGGRRAKAGDSKDGKDPRGE
jgi:transcriptional adapter 3